jgi:hypothetical protein
VGVRERYLALMGQNWRAERASSLRCTVRMERRGTRDGGDEYSLYCGRTE